MRGREGKHVERERNVKGKEACRGDGVRKREGRERERQRGGEGEKEGRTWQGIQCLR
jgi:hypothetical protein